MARRVLLCRAEATKAIMTTERRGTLVLRFKLTSAILLAATALPACAAQDETFEDDIEEAAGAVGWPGDNNLPPSAIDKDPLARPVTDSHEVTSPTNANPVPLCKAVTLTESGCALKSEWKAWLNADEENRLPVMKAITKCALEPGFTVQNPGGDEVFPGQFGLYTSWKSARLNGQDKRERMSSCILSLLNGNNEELAICILGPGGEPFSDACSDPTLTIREGGFFGDLFADTPTAYVVGPDTAEPMANGRACFAESGSYCCPEEDTACQHRVVLAGAILGSPEQGFANKRCNGPLLSSGGNQYCPSFFSTREPDRIYTNVFTTFVPPVD